MSTHALVQWADDDPFAGSVRFPGTFAGERDRFEAVVTETAAENASVWDTTPEVLKEATKAMPGDEIVAAIVNGELVGLNEDASRFAADGQPATASPVWLSTPLGHKVYWESAAHLVGAGLVRWAANQGLGEPYLAAVSSAVPDAAAAAHLRAAAEAQQRRDAGPWSDSDPEQSPAWCRALQGCFTVDAWLGDGVTSGDVDADAVTAVAAELAKSRARFSRAGDGFELEGVWSPPGPGAAGARLADTSLLRKKAVLRVLHGSEAVLRAGGSGEETVVTRWSGVAWPSKRLSAEWQAGVEAAAGRDHRTVGTAQSLWSLHPSAPGSPYMLPHGLRLVRRLQALVRAQISARGYQEVDTPQLFSTELWQRSGHWRNYREDMFVAAGADEWGAGAAPAAEDAEGGDDAARVLGLKPMNCPAHCVVFSSSARSYRELPLRIADFGALHRNEASGALTGLTRVRRFHQDDAHIFCAALDRGGSGQVRHEVAQCLDMVHEIFRRACGMTYGLRLATRPEKRLGADEAWDTAEGALSEALRAHEERFPGEVVSLPTAEGDGAFYGPKIDVTATDAMGRHHQCATIQLDFQLAGRFKLLYRDVDGSTQTPVIVHRALLGSFERMLAVLAEHFAGRWPLWLAPRQVGVVAVAKHQAAARAVAAVLAAPSAFAVAPELQAWQLGQQGDDLESAPAPGSDGTGLHVELDESDASVSKRVRRAQLLQVAVVVVVGASEVDNARLALRPRDDGVRAALRTAALELSAAAQELAAGRAAAAPGTTAHRSALEEASALLGLMSARGLGDAASLSEDLIAAARQPDDADMELVPAAAAAVMRVATAMRA